MREIAISNKLLFLGQDLINLASRFCDEFWRELGSNLIKCCHGFTACVWNKQSNTVDWRRRVSESFVVVDLSPKQCSVHSLEKQASFIRRHANIKLHHDNAGPHVLEKTKSFIKINKFN